jgi:hypothetical protein
MLIMSFSLHQRRRQTHRQALLQIREANVTLEPERHVLGNDDLIPGDRVGTSHVFAQCDGEILRRAPVLHENDGVANLAAENVGLVLADVHPQQPGELPEYQSAQRIGDVQLGD